MEVVDKSKFKFVGRDSRASEVIDTPTYSYWKSVARQFFSKKINLCDARHFVSNFIDELYLSHGCAL